MSHNNFPAAFVNSLVSYGSDDDDQDQDQDQDRDDSAHHVAQMHGPATTIPLIGPQPQPALQHAHPEAPVHDDDDAMDADKDKAPVRGPQLPAPRSHAAVSFSVESVSLPLELDTSSWTIPVIDNVTDLYSYSDFVAKFMHSCRIASQESLSPSRSNPYASSHLPFHTSPRHADRPAASSTFPSLSFAPPAVHCPLFSSFTTKPIPLPLPAPVSNIDPALDNKLRQWAHLKHAQGHHFTDAVLRAPDAGNPAVLHKLIEMFGIEEFGSQFRPLHPQERRVVKEGSGDQAKSKRGGFVAELVKRQAEAASRVVQQQRDHANGARSTISFVRGRTGDQPSDRW